MRVQGSMENIPPGYEPVSLIEALNGPHAPSSAPKLHPAIASPDTDTASQVTTRSHVILTIISPTLPFRVGSAHDYLFYLVYQLLFKLKLIVKLLKSS